MRRARRQARNAEPQRLGGSAFAALPELIRSPYLLGIATWISLQSFCATILYLEQTHLVALGVHGAGAQTRIFAMIDLAVTAQPGDADRRHRAVAQALRDRLSCRGAAGDLCNRLLPVFLAPTLAVVLIVQVMQRWMNFAFANPARQVFFTVLGREEKYKAKNLIDVVIYRGSDALYSWIFDSLQALGLKLGAIALVAVPVAAVWMVLSVALGRAQEVRAAFLDAGAMQGEWDESAMTRREFAMLRHAAATLAPAAFAQTSAAHIAPFPRSSFRHSYRRAPACGRPRHRGGF